MDTDKSINEAGQSLTIAHLLIEKHGLRDAEKRQEVREWLQDAQIYINGALQSLDRADEHAEAMGLD